eukprot:c29624_g1_i1.p1 GENE.c29624_g1_i1~~c29624_g1_i1.p1  ORF type:complete len:266 (-),score=-60.38 c29624_g1_i1:118-915(-)
MVSGIKSSILFIDNLFYSCSYDAPMPGQLGFQDAASSAMEGIIDLHHYLLFFLTTIGIFVTWMLFVAIWAFGVKYSSNLKYSLNVTHGNLLEIVWTIVPAVVLMFIAVPSFGLLYVLEDVREPGVTLKVVGHQWYWSYEYSDYFKDDGDTINFDSYMISEEDLEEGELRLLEADNQVLLPVDVNIRFLISSADVLHCFAVPSLGLKIDAVPGRLNQANAVIKRDGLFFGQCSEICRINQGFMPITIEALPVEDYIQWIIFKLEEN